MFAPPTLLTADARDDFVARLPESEYRTDFERQATRYGRASVDSPTASLWEEKRHARGSKVPDLITDRKDRRNPVRRAREVADPRLPIAVPRQPDPRDPHADDGILGMPSLR